MELIKPHHKPSERVSRANLGRAYAEAQALVAFLDEGNKVGFVGNWENAIAVSHCQVSEEPLALFAVQSAMLVNSKSPQIRHQNRKNYYFPTRVVFNAEIIEAEDKLERLVPKRVIERVPNSKEMTAKLTREYKMVPNIIEAPDACMSYPNKTKKCTNRYHTIKVRYQIMRSFLGFKWLKTVTEEVDGFKAHVFQHEVDHAYGIDMYYGNGEDRNPVKPYKNAGAKPDSENENGNTNQS